MAEKIQIDAGHNQSITAFYSKPAERSTTRLDQTLVIMSHGFPGHKEAHHNIFGDIESILAERRYHTLRFDYRGCGESDGREEDFTLAAACEDFQAVLYWAKSKGYQRFIFAGEGIGGALAIMNMGPDVRALVLLWPVFDLRGYAKSGLGLDKVSEQDKGRGYVESRQRRVGLALCSELMKIDIRNALKEVYAPTVIFHGAQDSAIPAAQLDIARRTIPAKRIEITTFHDGKAGLEQQNHRKALLFQTRQFIEKYI